MSPPNTLRTPYEGETIGLLVLGRTDLVHLAAPSPYVLVSITDPGKPDAWFPDGAECKDVLRLRFHDIGPAHERYLLDTSAFVRMDASQAEQVAAFARRWVGSVPLLVAQCEAGISRSAAVAAAISKVYNGDDAFFFEHYVPNTMVYEMVLRAIGEPCPAADQPHP